MPHTAHPSTARAVLAPVPVAILLPPATTRYRRGGTGAPGRISDHTACQLIARYTHSGELVIDLDANPAIAAAARWLERRSLTVTNPAAAEPNGREFAARPGAGPARLVIATMPRPGATALASITQWLRLVGDQLLAPGGFLLTVVSTIGARRHTDHATTIITAATAAGLSWHQHIIDVHTPLPEHEPRTEPDTAATVSPRLGRGRHWRAHNDLFAFTTTGGEDPDA